MTKAMWVHRHLTPRTMKAHMCVVSKTDDDGTFWSVHGVWVPNSVREWVKTVDGKGEEMGDDIKEWFWPKIRRFERLLSQVYNYPY